MSETVTDEMVAAALAIYHDEDVRFAEPAMRKALSAACSHIRAQARNAALEEVATECERRENELDEQSRASEAGRIAEFIRALMNKPDKREG